MRPWIEFAAQLYPASWRDRYGIEFRALLDDLNPGWRELFDVLYGALKMRLTNAPSYLKFAAAFALLGVAAGIITLPLAPRQYVAKAALRITPTEFSEAGVPKFDPVPFTLVEQEALSRSSLSHIIQSLDLYPSQRKRYPLLDVINSMRQQDIQFSIAPTGNTAATVHIAFTYPDRNKAQLLVSAMVAQISQNFARHREVNSHMRGAVPIHQNLEVIDAPHLLKTTQGPSPLVYSFTGLVCGLLLGLLVSAFVHDTRTTIVFVCLGGGCCLIGFAISLLLPKRYVSTASVRIVYFDRTAGTAEGRDWLVKNMNEVLSRESLSEIIQRPELNLYQTERAKLPLEKVLDRIRDGDISFHIKEDGRGVPSTTLEISFTYRDRAKTQSMLNAVIQRFIGESRNSIQLTDRPGSELKSGVVEYLDNADYPVSSADYNHTLGSLIGLAFGVGAAVLLFRRNSKISSPASAALGQ
jgi:hypothetical protein